MKNKKEISYFLTEKMIEKISLLVKYYMVSISDSDEAKKSINTALFLENMMAGKPFKKEDAPFIEKHKELLNEIWEYNTDIEEINKL